MAPSEDSAMHRELGMLSTKVDMLIEINRRSEEKSEISRASMHRRLDDMIDRVGKIESTVDAMQEEIEEMKPVTEDVRRWKSMWLGAAGLVGLAGTALGAMFSGAFHRFIELLRSV